MMLLNQRALFLTILISAVSMFAMADDTDAANTDSLYAEIQRTVADVDFGGMAAVYHPDAVLVSARSTVAISDIMPRWKAAGEKLQRDGGQASVAFRFTARQHNETSAFDSGIFRYATIDADGVEKATFVYFENLSVYRDGRWLTMMERQMAPTSESDWNTLADSWK
jgi:hypothetical protein